MNGDDKVYTKLIESQGLLARWANQIHGFYGHPVYLVGSALEKENPRDISVCCIIPDEEFMARYKRQRY